MRPTFGHTFSYHYKNPDETQTEMQNVDLMLVLLEFVKSKAKQSQNSCIRSKGILISQITCQRIQDNQTDSNQAGFSLACGHKYTCEIVDQTHHKQQPPLNRPIN